MTRGRIGSALMGALVAVLVAALTGCQAGDDGDSGQAHSSPSATVGGIAPQNPTTPPQVGPTTPPRVTPTVPPTGSGPKYERRRKLTECMRANGFPDFPYPNPDGSLPLDKLAGMDMARLQQVFVEYCSQYH